jgi:hypothetical protein
MRHHVRIAGFGFVLFFATASFLLPMRAARAYLTAPGSPSGAIPNGSSHDQSGSVAKEGAGPTQTSELKSDLMPVVIQHRSRGETGGEFSDNVPAEVIPKAAPYVVSRKLHPQSSGMLTINATFDSSILNNTKNLEIQAMVKQAISLFLTDFTTRIPVTVSILFRYSQTTPDGSQFIDPDVSRSNSGDYPTSWSSYVAALQQSATSPNDASAIKSLPPSPMSPNIYISSANARAIGFSQASPMLFADGSMGSGGLYDGIVTLNSDQPLQFTRNTNQVSSGNYDALRLAEHEIDEVLGLGSYLNLPQPNASVALRPQDLFSWLSPGNRTVSPTATPRYFSVDGGATNVVGFNQTKNLDFGDWLSGACPQPNSLVQNAKTCTGQTADISAGSPEGISLDIIGYTAGCGFTISPIDQSFPANGGTANISIAEFATCSWTASSNASWVTITSAAGGAGNGVVSYSVAPNTGGSPRSGTVSVADHTFEVLQAGAGAGSVVNLAVDDGSFEEDIGPIGGGTIYGVNRLTPPSYPATLSQLNIFFDTGQGLSPGNPITLLIGANPSGSTNINGITFQQVSASITAVGTFNLYNVPELTINSGDFVVGFQITTGSHVFPIADDTDSQRDMRSYLSTDGVNFVLSDDQANLAGNFGIRATVSPGLSCSFSVSPTKQSFTASAGNGAVSVATSSGCPWSAVSDSSWLTVASGSTGIGSLAIGYAVAPNNDSYFRSGTLTIGDQIFIVDQAGAPCNFSISASSQSFPGSGGTGAVNVNTNTNCSWIASSNASFITITSGLSGGGAGAVNYTVAQNTGAASRTGTMSIAGQTFTVTQSGVGSGGASVQLAVDDGSFNDGDGFTSGSIECGVNRFTPDHYPATLSQVAIYFGSGFGLSAGQNITVLAGTNPSGSTSIDGAIFQSFQGTIAALNQFNVYNTPNLTINSGDFIVGFEMAPAPEVFPFAKDTSSHPQRRSYLSSDRLNFYLNDDFSTVSPGNFGIRAEVLEPGAGGPFPSIANLSADLEGDTLTATGTAFDPAADMTGYQITLSDSSDNVVGHTGLQSIDFGSSTASYFALGITNMEDFPTAVSATVAIFDQQGNSGPAVSVTFGDADAGGPAISSVALSEAGVMTIKGGIFFGALELELNGQIVAPPLPIKLKGGGTKLKISGVTIGAGPNRIRIFADKFKSNIFVFSR